MMRCSACTALFLVVTVLLVSAPTRAEFLSPGRAEVFDLGSDQQLIFAIGLDGHLYEKAGGGRWIDRGPESPLAPLSTVMGLSGVTYETAGGEQWAIYSIGDNGNLYEFRFDPAAPCGSAYCWFDLGAACGEWPGGVCSGPVSAIVHTVRGGYFPYVRVFVRGSDFGLWEKRRFTVSYGWTNPVDHGMPAGSWFWTSPIGTTLGNKRLNVFARGADWRVYHKSFVHLAADGPWTSLGDPSGRTAVHESNVAATAVDRTCSGRPCTLPAVYVRGSTWGWVWRWVQYRGWEYLSEFAVSSTANSIDAIGDAAFAAGADGALRIYDSGSWEYVDKPYDTSVGVTGPVTAIDEPDLGRGYLVFAIAQMQPAGESAIRYLYERRVDAEVWSNHATYRPGPDGWDSLEQVGAIAANKVPNGEPVLGEYYGRLIAATRYYSPGATPSCPRDSLIAVGFSDDDGVTWSDGGVVPPPGDWAYDLEMMRDPSVTFAIAGSGAYGAGTGYLALLAVDLAPSDGCTTAIWGDTYILVYRTSNYGACWNRCLTVDSAGSRGLDTPWLAATPDGRVYVAYQRTVLNPLGSELVVKYLESGDDCTLADSWTTASIVDNVPQSTGYAGIYSDALGTLFLHRWQNPSNPTVNIARSTDGGENWGSWSVVGSSLNTTVGFSGSGSGGCDPAGGSVYGANATPGVSVLTTDRENIGVARVDDPSADFDVFYANKLAWTTPWNDLGPWGPTAGEQFGASTELMEGVSGPVRVLRAFLTFYDSDGSASYRPYIMLGTLSDLSQTWNGKYLSSTYSCMNELWPGSVVATRFIGEYRYSSGGRGLHHHPIWIDTRDQGSPPDGDGRAHVSFVAPVYW